MQARNCEWQRKWDKGCERVNKEERNCDLSQMLKEISVQLNKGAVCPISFLFQTFNIAADGRKCAVKHGEATG